VVWAASVALADPVAPVVWAASVALAGLVGPVASVALADLAAPVAWAVSVALAVLAGASASRKVLQVRSMAWAADVRLDSSDNAARRVGRSPSSDRPEVVRAAAASRAEVAVVVARVAVAARAVAAVDGVRRLSRWEFSKPDLARYWR
jgi:hypothetical protein